MASEREWSQTVQRLRDKREQDRKRIAALVAALQKMTDHAQETYPHFESERGQADIKQALEALELAAL